MGKIPLKDTNERREKVWFLMLKGHNPQSIIKTLGITKTVVYNDLNFLTEKSKQYVYDMAKGTHVLMYQRAIEGIALALTEAWKKFNDPKVPEKQKLGYLRLTMEANESMIDLTANGVSVLAVNNIVERANRLGIDHKPLAFSDSYSQDAPLAYNDNNKALSTDNGKDKDNINESSE